MAGYAFLLHVRLPQLPGMKAEPCAPVIGRGSDSTYASAPRKPEAEIPAP